MGWGITRYQRWVFRWGRSPRSQRLAGVLLAIVYPLLWGLVAAGGVVLVGEGSAILAGLLASLLLASCLAGRSLRDAAGDVLGPWQQGDLPQARQRLARYVGRETAELDSPEILRAVL
jgi:adenosylcobinamide-phosphate synthase